MKLLDIPFELVVRDPVRLARICEYGSQRLRVGLADNARFNRDLA
jgi:hypothetical protein